MKIKHQFFLLILLAVLLVLLLQTVYYFQLANVTQKKVEAFTDNMAAQVEETTTLLFQKANNAANHYAFSKSVQKFMASNDTFELFDTKKYVEDIIKTAVEINNEIQNVLLITPEGKKRYYYNDLSDDLFAVVEDLNKDIQRNKGFKGFVYIKSNQSDNKGFVAYVMPIVNIAADTRNGENIGSIIIFLNADVLEQIMRKTAMPTGVEFYLLDTEGKVVVSNNEAMENIWLTEKGVGNVRGNKNITIKKDIGTSGWSVVSIINRTDVVQDYNFFRSFAMNVGIIMILLLLMLGLAFNYNIAKPILRLLEEMGKIGDGKLKARLKIHHSNEIGVIGEHINQMLDNIEMLSRRIFETQQKMYEIDLSRKQTEIYALQSQVNPHFLFNTIQCIGGIAASRDISDVAEVAASMGEIFRYSIKGQDFVKIADEINIVREYLKIIEVRFSGKIHWKIDVQEDILEIKTIKMILQPLIENAVYHGLEKSYEEGHLTVTGWKENEDAVIEIWDNGPGIEAEVLQNIQSILMDMTKLENESRKRQKIGIANVQWRIKLMLGQEYGLEVASEKGQGTTVRVKLPL